MNKKPTDSEIVKALEEQLNLMGYVTNGCYLDTVQSFQMYETLRVSLDLINRLQAENERLTKSVTTLTKSISELTDEVERQKKAKDESFLFAANIYEAEKIVIAETKAEAYKECIEKVKALFPSDNEPYQYWEIHEGADNLLKELKGND